MIYITQKTNMEKNVEITESGLQCDNPNCDWTDVTVKFDDYRDWLNKPCPKCGDNVLTDEDYANAELLRKGIDRVNAMTAEELDAFNALVGVSPETLMKYLEDSKLFKVADLGVLKDNPFDALTMTVHTHKGINITDIKPTRDK